MNKYVIDANVIVRYLLSDDKEIYKKARHFFDLLKMGKAKAHLDQAVFTEVVFVLSKLHKVSKEDIAKSLSNLLLHKGVLNDKKDVLMKALELYATTNLHIADCMVVAKCIIDQLAPMTFDKELQEIAITE